jgi:hypothetical protein
VVREVGTSLTPAAWRKKPANDSVHPHLTLTSNPWHQNSVGKRLTSATKDALRGP